MPQIPNLNTSPAELHALVRDPSPEMERCALTFIERVPINFDVAVRQHQSYIEQLRKLGLHVAVAPALASCPDCVFVEDAAIVFDELSILTRIGNETRRAEHDGVVDYLPKDRPLHRIDTPGTIDGGDVVRVDKTLYVGISRRTNTAATEQLRQLLFPHGYTVLDVPIAGCLHLKTGCSYLGGNTLLINGDWIPRSAFPEFDFIEIPREEPFAANVLKIGNTLVCASSAPKTNQLLRSNGFDIAEIDISEYQKAEAGVTCMSIVFTHQR